MITYLQGDATYPVGDGPKIIMHVCNDRGGWGSGFVLAISKRWSQPEAMYRAWKSCNDRFLLGETQDVLVEVKPAIWVSNMIAQHGYGENNTRQHRTSEPDSRIPLDYVALECCLRNVAESARNLGATIHAPRIGCGLAGGTWDRVEPLIIEAFKDISVFIYDLPEEP